MSGYYKKSNGKVVELEQQVYLWLWSENIIELIIPDGCEYVSCWNNQLKELVIPNGCGWVWADMKSVTELNKAYRLNLWI